MAIFKRGKTWWVDFTTPAGRRVRQSAQTGSKQEAQEFHDRLKADAWRKEVLREKPARTWKEAAVRWTQETAHKKDHERDLKKILWLDQFFGSLSLGDINEDLIEEIIEVKRDEGAQPPTINRWLALIRAILRTAVNKWRWIDSMPYIPRFKETEGRERFLSRQEADRLVTALYPAYRDPARFSLATGLRQSRVLRAKWSEIDLARREMTIPGIKMKNGRPLQIPLNDDALEVLVRQQGCHPVYVFTDEGEPVFSIDSKKWKAALKAADLDDVRWHDLRHTWSSWHVQAGTTLLQLMELGGWKSFVMVQRYSHFNTQHLVQPAKNVERHKEEPKPSSPSTTPAKKRAVDVPYLRVVR